MVEELKTSQQQELDKYGRPFPPKLGGYCVPRTAADAIVLREDKQNDDYQVLLITRKKETFHGKLAFPGGHIDYNEDPVDSCIRELEEECGIKATSKPELVAVRGAPERDPRYHMISVFYLVQVPEDAQITAGDDAATAQFYGLKDVMKTPDRFAFDHYEVLTELINTRPELEKIRGTF
eukprot:403373799